MSRRERSSRDSDFRRHRSGFDKESSPKRSRRDGKQETERVNSKTDLNTEDRRDRDQKHQRGVHDSLPLDAPSVPDSKLESGVVGKDFGKNPNGRDEGTKGLYDLTDVPRSRSYSQHDERGNRSSGWRPSTDRRQRDPKDDHHASQQKNGRSEGKRDTSDVWRHDGFMKMEAGPAPPVRKRPAFREKKIPLDPENVAKEAPKPDKPSYPDRPMSLSERRAERDHNSHYSNRYGKPVAIDRKAALRGSLLSRDRYSGRYSGGGSGSDGRERFSGRQGYELGGNRAEKWKHDLFDEANKSPTKKNEEDQIAKVEALLSA